MTGPLGPPPTEDAMRDAAALVAAFMREDHEGQRVILDNADPLVLTAGTVSVCAAVLAGWGQSIGVPPGEVFGWAAGLLFEGLAAAAAGQEG